MLALLSYQRALLPYSLVAQVALARAHWSSLLSAVQPRIYIAARRASATTDLLEELHEKNPGGTYTVIEKNVSLICETNDVITK